MAKKTSRPQSPFAKADAKLTATYRRVYPNWDDDAARFGVRVADYNAGFIAGDNNGWKKSRKAKR